MKNELVPALFISLKRRVIWDDQTYCPPLLPATPSLILLLFLATNCWVSQPGHLNRDRISHSKAQFPAWPFPARSSCKLSFSFFFPCLGAVCLTYIFHCGVTYTLSLTYIFKLKNKNSRKMLVDVYGKQKPSPAGRSPSSCPKVRLIKQLLFIPLHLFVPAVST